MTGLRSIDPGANQRWADPMMSAEVPCTRTWAARWCQPSGSPIFAADAMIAAELTSPGWRRSSSSPTAPPSETPA